MPNIESVGGVDSYLLYAEESTYGTDPGSGYAHFGVVKSFKSSVNNEVTKLRGFIGSSSGGRNVEHFVPGKLTVNATVEMDINDWAFLEFVMGAVSGSGPYVYDEANLTPSLSLHHAIDNPGTSSTDQDLSILGAVIDSVTIRASVGEPVSATINFMGATQTVDSTIPSNVSMLADDVFNFAGATIELPNSTAISNIIDSVEITIKNNQEILYGLGSRLGQKAIAKELEYTIKFTVKYLDNDLMTKLLGAATPTATGGPTENASIAVKFEKGTQSADFVFTDFVIDEGTLNADLNQVIGEDISGTAGSLQVTDDRT